MTIEVPKAQLHKVERLLKWLLVVLVALIAGLGWTSYVGRLDLVESSRAGCERGKKDRLSIAEAFRAQSDYLMLVLNARSVQEDVKSAARINQAIQNASASDLESRTGDQFDCVDAFPDPPLIPLP